MILAELRAIEQEILQGIEELEGMLRRNGQLLNLERFVIFCLDLHFSQSFSRSSQLECLSFGLETSCRARAAPSIAVTISPRT